MIQSPLTSPDEIYDTNKRRTNAHRPLDDRVREAISKLELPKCMGASGEDIAVGIALLKSTGKHISATSTSAQHAQTNNALAANC